MYILNGDIMKYCDCDFPKSHRAPYEDNIKNGLLYCVICNKVIECEFSYMNDNPHPAELTHFGYCICREHEGMAVDNVHSETMCDCDIASRFEKPKN